MARNNPKIIPTGKSLGCTIEGIDVAKPQVIRHVCAVTRVVARSCAVI